MDNQSDLYKKYYKVATEYSKLRAKVPVLKKALTDEQQKNVELRQMIKVKDQSLRIAAAETDSLSFRNQHLMCRLTSLLQEMEDLRNPHKKPDHKNAQDDEAFKKTMMEEFNKMVDQNAELITTLSDIKQKHQEEINDLLEEIKRQNTEIFKIKESYGNQKKLNFDTNSLSDSSEVSKDVEIHFDLSPKIKHREEKMKHDDPFSDPFDPCLKMNEGSNSSREDVEGRDGKDSVGSAIQKALEEQLIESQQLLQKSKSEYDCLMATYKTLQGQYKELKEKSTQPVETTSTVIFEGEINYIPHEEALAREKEVKRCYQHKNDLMRTEVLQWKSRSQTFERECQILKLRLDDEISSHNNSKAALKSETDFLQKIKDELLTTESNYEAQLSAMSDHVANLNDILTKKKDEIVELKYCLENKSKSWRK